MSDKRASPGVPLPTFSQMLLTAAAACAAWLIWTASGGLVPGTGPQRDREAEQLAEALDHLSRLEKLAQSDPDALPAVIAELTNANPRMRRNALLAMRRFGPKAQAGLGPIRERLADHDSQTRQYAIDAYWQICRDPDDVAPVIAPALGDENSEVRLLTARILETIGPPSVAPVTNLLGGETALAHVPALLVLRQIGWNDTQQQTEDSVRRLVYDCDPEVCHEARLTLVACGHPTTAEIRELLRKEPTANALRHGPWSFSSSHALALNTVSRLGPAAAGNLPEVLALLTDKREVFMSARLPARALASLKSAALPAVPQLLGLLDEFHDSNRLEVAWALLEIGVEPREIIRIVTPLLAAASTDTCYRAGRLSARASPEEARRLVSALIPRLSVDNPVVQRSTAHALWGLAPEAGEAVPALSRVLESHDRNLIYPSAMALGEIGPAAASAVPAMRALLADNSPERDPWIRGPIFRALESLGPAARSALPDFLAELRSPHYLYPYPRRPDPSDQGPDLATIRALVSIGGDDPDVLAALQHLVLSRNAGVQYAALQSLWNLTPDSPEIFTGLLQLLTESHGGSPRIGAILAIGGLKGDRQDAVGPLSAALADEDPEIRKAAAWCLGTMGPEGAAALPALRDALTVWQNSFCDPSRYARWALDGVDERFYERRFQQRVSFENGEVSRRLARLSVQQAVREAIAAIDPGSAPDKHRQTGDGLSRSQASIAENDRAPGDDGGHSQE
jgi:HEAT repeat protein